MKGSAVAQFKSQEISRNSRLLPQSYALQQYYANELNLSGMCQSCLTHSIDIPYSNVCPLNNTSRPNPARPTRLDRLGDTRRPDLARPDMTRLDRPGPARSDPAVFKTGHQPARPTQPFPPLKPITTSAAVPTIDRPQKRCLYVVLQILRYFSKLSSQCSCSNWPNYTNHLMEQLN